MAEMLTDLLKNIYDRISQLGKEIQSLKGSLDDLNRNIEENINALNTRLGQFSEEIQVTQTKHLDVLERIGDNATNKIDSVKETIGLKSIDGLISNLEQFSALSEDLLKQEHVELLLSEAINSVKTIKKEKLGIDESKPQ
jgi:ABC-type transporter Mla subunit MlaD